MSKPVTYKTHFLIGYKTGGSATEIERWDHVPTGPQVQAAIDRTVQNFNEFVLVQPVGDTYPGTYTPPHDDACYG